jgi:hypothetical protein
MADQQAFPADVKGLIELQLELECKGVVNGNTLVRIPGRDPDDIPRFLVIQHEQSYIAYFRHDLSPHVRLQLTTLPFEQAFHDHEQVKAILANYTPCEDMFIGKSYVFPQTLTTDLYPDAVRLDELRHCDLLQRYEHWQSVNGKTVFGIIIEGCIVSSCGSVRENDKSAEAWVITEPAFRGRGYARQVTAAWAHSIQQQGKVPFYSHAQHNLASQGVARSLGLVQFLSAVAYS